MKDYYKILHCNENSTYEEIKNNYQRLVRIHHPDKCDDILKTEVFYKIDEAWKVLKDENLRKQYNNKLLNARLSNNVLKYANLSIEDLDYNSDENFYSYNCRCGGHYILSTENINEDCIVSCDECSLFVEYNCK